MPPKFKPPLPYGASLKTFSPVLKERHVLYVVKDSQLVFSVRPYGIFEPLRSF